VGQGDALGRGLLTTYVLDTTALIAHLRGDEQVMPLLLDLVAEGHTLATTCVNVAEVEAGLRPSERRRVEAILTRLRFLVTDREAAIRAGRYHSDWAKRGRTIHTPDALVAGTARAHGAVVVTDNLDDFPMRDIRIAPIPGATDG
jgi:predicted nucleic acid-binding protein